MDWIYGLLVVGLAVGIVLVALLIRRGRSGEPVRQDVDPLFTMGIAFVGAGVALVAAVGVGMLGILALGVIFMFVGLSRMRSQGR